MRVLNVPLVYQHEIFCDNVYKPKILSTTLKNLEKLALKRLTIFVKKLHCSCWMHSKYSFARCLRPCHISMMEFLCKNRQRLKAVKKLYHRCLAGFVAYLWHTFHTSRSHRQKLKLKRTLLPYFSNYNTYCSTRRKLRNRFYVAKTNCILWEFTLTVSEKFNLSKCYKITKTWVIRNQRKPLKVDSRVR